MHTLLVLALPAALGGCLAGQTRVPAELCGPQRPQICPQIHAPVCAVRRDGSRHTYTNGCRACSDTRVTGFDPQPCAREAAP